MTVMESAGMLTIPAQARAPTWREGSAAVAGPPGTPDALLWEASPCGTRGRPAGLSSEETHAKFATLLQRVLGVGPRQASSLGSPGAVTTAPVAAEGDPPDEGRERIEDKPEGTGDPRARKGARVTLQATMVAASPIVPISMPLDLIQGAANSEPAPEQDGTSADNDMAIAAAGPVGAASASPGAVATQASLATVVPLASLSSSPRIGEAGAPPAPEESQLDQGRASASASASPGAVATQAGLATVVPLASLSSSPGISEVGAPPAPEESQLDQGRASASASIAVAPERLGPPTDAPSTSAQPTGESRDTEPMAPGSVAASARPAEPTSDGDQVQPESDETIGFAEPAPAKPAQEQESPRSPLPSRPTGTKPEAAGLDDRRSAEVSAPPRAGAAAPLLDAAQPADDGERAPTSVAPPREGAPGRQTQAPSATRQPAETRPDRHQQGVPAEGDPAVLPASVRGLLVHWLPASERVDETRALEQAQRLLASNLADDIRRLTFQGQERAFLQLQPPELGKVSIRLDVHEGGLSVEMTVETEAVRAVVASTLGQLQTALAQHGLTTSYVYVGVGQNAHRDPEAWQARGGRDVRQTSTAPAPLVADAPSQGRAVGFGSTVDYRI